MNYIQITKQDLSYKVTEMDKYGNELFQIGYWNSLEKAVEKARYFVEFMNDGGTEISNELKIV